MRQLHDEIDQNGVTVARGLRLKPGMTLKPGHQWVPHQPDLEITREKLKSWVETTRDYQCFKPVVWGGHTWQADPRSQELIAQAVSLAASGAAPVPGTWRTLDNQDVPIDLDYLKGLAGVIAEQVQSSYQRSWDLKAAIASAQTIQELNNIRW